MRQLGSLKAKPERAVVSIAAALLGAAVLCHPDPTHAAPHGGGGGFRGGGFQSGGFGGCHGGGFHADAFHGGVAGLHNGFGDDHGRHWYHGWHNGRYAWWWGDGLGWTYYPYPDALENYDYRPPYAGQTWYYCSDPA